MVQCNRPLQLSRAASGYQGVVTNRPPPDITIREAAIAAGDLTLNWCTAFGFGCNKAVRRGYIGWTHLCPGAAEPVRWIMNRSPSSTRRARSAFSLVELLVVIGIIGL